VRAVTREEVSLDLVNISRFFQVRVRLEELGQDRLGRLYLRMPGCPGAIIVGGPTLENQNGGASMQTLEGKNYDWRLYMTEDDFANLRAWLTLADREKQPCSEARLRRKLDTLYHPLRAEIAGRVQVQRARPV